MTPFEKWKKNVLDHPEKMVFSEYYWRDSITEWECNLSIGWMHYSLRSPNGGKIKLTPFEKYKMKHLLYWWAEGSLSEKKVCSHKFKRRGL